MNLNSIVRGAVGAVNPTIWVSIQRSTGSAIQPDGTRVPSYAPPVQMRGQLQSLQYNDIAQLDGLNIQGERRALYLNGAWEGVVRADGKGGDLVTLPDGSEWLVALVLENWSATSGWVKLALTRQIS